MPSPPKGRCAEVGEEADKDRLCVLAGLGDAPANKSGGKGLFDTIERRQPLAKESEGLD